MNLSLEICPSPLLGSVYHCNHREFFSFYQLQVRFAGNKISLRSNVTRNSGYGGQTHQVIRAAGTVCSQQGTGFKVIFKQGSGTQALPHPGAPPPTPMGSHHPSQPQLQSDNRNDPR